jgi:nucleotide-binding universal stress UspA family protein
VIGSEETLMSFKNILAYCNNAKTAERLFSVAVGLAQKYDAHVTGLYIVPQPHLHAAVGEEFIGELMTSQEEYFDEQGDLIKAAFDKARGKNRAKNEWVKIHSSTAFVRGTLVDTARYSDLIVMSQTDSDYDVAHEPGLPEEVVLESGRPVLVIPNKGDVSTIGQNIMVAWNSSRESARAVGDALPFMTGSKLVKIVELMDDDRSAKDRPNAADIAANLKRHGVKAEDSETPLDDRDVGEYFLRRAKREKCDLLVMGGYGRTRVSEFILGGATRHVLQEMSLPVLMSH